MPEDPNDDKLTVRMPRELHRRLKVVAEKNGRYVSQEILWVVRNHVDREERKD